MTVSSLDLSNSTPSSESFSSVSSVNSSVSSEESEEDYQHQWNVLWKKHYEDQYLEQYNKFIQSVIGVVASGMFWSVILRIFTIVAHLCGLKRA